MLMMITLHSLKKLKLSSHFVLLCSIHGDRDEDDEGDEEHGDDFKDGNDKEKARLTEEVEVELTLCVTLFYPRRLDMRERGRAFRVCAVLVVCLKKIMI